MPYVEVWVDDPECDGNCDRSIELRRRRDYAVGLLFGGQVNEAIDALTKGRLPADWTCGDDLRAQYNEWSKGGMAGLPGPASHTKEVEADDRA